MAVRIGGAVRGQKMAGCRKGGEELPLFLAPSFGLVPVQRRRLGTQLENDKGRRT